MEIDGMNADDFLEHYGVKGMKWGRRRADRESPSEDAQRVGGIHARVGTQKSTKMLSNKELQDAISRMQLEQQYSRLSGGRDKTRIQKATRFIAEIMGTAGKQSVQQVATNNVKSQVEDAIKKNRG